MVTRLSERLVIATEIGIFLGAIFFAVKPPHDIVRWIAISIATLLFTATPYVGARRMYIELEKKLASLRDYERLKAEQEQSPLPFITIEFQRLSFDLNEGWARLHGVIRSRLVQSLQLQSISAYVTLGDSKAFICKSTDSPIVVKGIVETHHGITVFSLAPLEMREVIDRAKEKIGKTVIVQGGHVELETEDRKTLRIEVIEDERGISGQRISIEAYPNRKLEEWLEK